MVKHKKLSMAVAGACALFGASAANAFGPIKAGDWDLSVAGNVNQFYVFTRCAVNNNSIDGGLTCGSSDGLNNNTNSSSSVRSGLLPSAIVFSGKTTQEGFDLGVTFGFYPTTSIGARQFSEGEINMRQNFLTFGDKEIGTIKMGRDLGIFGSDAIVSDFTILGVGSTGGNLAPGNTSLGRIGFGYIYADWIPQITYISPSSGGLQASIGIFQPLISSGSITLSGHTTPGWQGKLTYDYDVGGVTGRAWAGFFYQRSFALAGDNTGGPFVLDPATGLISGTTPSLLDATNVGVTAIAGDVGIKANVFGFEPVFYYYRGTGIGTTAPLLNGADSSGNERDSDGGYVQLSYRLGKWKPGISYGVSRLERASGEAKSTLVQKNRSAVGQMQYSLTKALTLVGEYTFSKSNNQLGAENIESSIAAGAILFF